MVVVNLRIYVLSIDRLHWFCQTQENTIPMSRKVMFSLLLLNGLSEKVKRKIWLFNVVQDKK